MHGTAALPLRRERDGAGVTTPDCRLRHRPLLLSWALLRLAWCRAIHSGAPIVLRRWPRLSHSCHVRSTKGI